MKIFAIDPGCIHSGIITYDTNLQEIQIKEKADNYRVLDLLKQSFLYDTLIIENISNYGMAVGREVFDTLIWIGRFMQVSIDKDIQLEKQIKLIYRKEVKLHFCNSTKATDTNIRQVIIDRFGGKEKAIGKKGSYGKLHGITADVWSALALAYYYVEINGIMKR